MNAQQTFMSFVFYFCIVCLIWYCLKWFYYQMKDPEFREGFFRGMSGSKSSDSDYDEDDYGKYVIQYRSGSTWVDGPGSNNERTADNMFDSFLENDPRASKRCRLVYKVNGRVRSVISTN